MSFLNRMRYLNKHIFNRVMIRLAGSSRSPLSIVRHIGRRSKKAYETPVIIEPIAGGFVFTLPYGPEVDWYRNVLAAGECTVHWHGKIYALENPEPVDVQTALPAFPLPLRLILKIMGTQHFFRMKIQETG